MGWLNDLGEFFQKLKNPHLFIIDQLTMIIEIYQSFLLDIVNSKQFNDSLGGTVVLAGAVLILVHMIITLIMIATFWKDNSDRVGRMFSTTGAQFLFIAGFYPLCFAGLYLISALQYLFAYLMGIQPAEFTDQVNKMVLPVGLDPFWGGVIIVIIALMGLVLLIVMVAVMAFSVLLILLYPLIIALRPLGGFFDSVFHSFTAGIIVAIISPVLTTFCLTLPLVVYRHVPVGQAGIVQAGLIIVAYGAAIAVPYKLWKALRARSVKAYGKVESTISGRVDVNSLPPQSYESGMRAVDDANDSPLKSFVQVAAIGGAAALAGDKEDLKETLKNVSADAVAAGAMATKNPYLMVGGLALQGINSGQKAKQERQKQERAELNKMPPPERPLSSYPPPPEPDQYPLPGT